MFKTVPVRPNTTQMEDVLVRFWKTWRIPESCEEGRRGSGEFVYYEKPPLTSAKPGLAQIIPRAFSDLFLRYKTMRGYHILRRSGWQAHGLPVELMAGRQSGLSVKSEIDEYGLAHFNQRCRHTLDYYAPNWERMNDRLGYWTDPQEAYLTLTNEYIESVWWAVKSLWDKNLLYQTLKVMPYCPSCGVHLSADEILPGSHATEKFTLCVRLPLVNGPGTSLLTMTDEPWTLVGNAALAVNPDAEYITIEQEAPGGGSEHLVVSKECANQIFGNIPLQVVDKFKGRKLKGEPYFPLYTYILPQKNAHCVIVDDAVSEKIGTGLAHIAPSFKEQDLQIAQLHDLPLLNPITDAGTFVPEVRPWSGKFVRDAIPFIIQDLDARGLLFDVESDLHMPPHCMYCDSPVLDYVTNAWFVRFSQYEAQLQTLNQHTKEYSLQGKGKTLNRPERSNDADKALGYNRYWGTPIPIWECQTCHHQVCVGSLDEFSKLAGFTQTDLDLHRPHIDEVYLICPECRGQLVRISDLIHPWFESACMSFASWHYPFENQTLFEQQVPADLVCTSLQQNDDWLKDLQAIHAILFEKAGYKNALSLSSFSTGQLKSGTSSLRMDAELSSVMSEFGADVFRWYLYERWLPENHGEDKRIALEEDAIKAVRKSICLLWYAYTFFINQANHDQWSPLDIPKVPEYTVVDKWLRSELHSLILNVTTTFEVYDPHTVVTHLQTFIHKFSRWYIPQTRIRLSSHNRETEKTATYALLYETMVALCQLCAPVTPFLAEEMYQNLLENTPMQDFVSVHLAEWPIADLSALDETLMSDMDEVMELASLGRAARKMANIPIYQPLSEITFITRLNLQQCSLMAYRELLQTGLNIKDVKFLNLSNHDEAASPQSQYVMVSQGANKAVLVTQLTSELIDEGVVQQVIRRVNTLRRQAGLKRSDPIRLLIKTGPMCAEIIFRFRQTIVEQALVSEISENVGENIPLSHFEINGKTILIGIEKII